ncbi:MAG: DUF4012 domain-containing protein [bacterium]|nr:DUF4012 domain-containing protein [bacterium]
MEENHYENEPRKTSDMIRRETKEIKKEREFKSEEVLEKIATGGKESPFGANLAGGGPPLDLHLVSPGAFPKKIIWGIAFLVIIFVGSFGYYLYISASARFVNSISKNLNQIQSGVEDLRKLDSKSALEKFSAANDDLNLTFSDIFSRFKPLFEGAGEFFGSFQKLTNLSVVLTQEISFFENNLLPLFLDKNGSEIISHLEKTQEVLGEINKESDKLSSGADKLKNISPGAIADVYLPIRLDIVKSQKLLDAALAWLKSDSPRHLLIMLQNPSEIRPSGGFLGSYADLTVNKAGLEEILVHDINDADRLLDLKIIPPRPLQAEVTRLRAADANWFFDFSKSAAVVLKLIEASKLYASSSIIFDGAVGVSPKILGDLLTLTGPIELPKEKLILDKDNFLIELQKRVQIGQAERATYPKNALKELSTEMVQRLKNLSEPEKRELLNLAQEWFAEKDIMLYFKDPQLENFFDDFGIAGKSYSPPANFQGDYLALVDANVGGGKSDLFIKQTVVLQSQINSSGTVASHLSISREHQGNKSKYSWYKVTNQDYLQIFVPASSQLINFRGGAEKKIIPAVNYVKNGYIVDPLIAEDEASLQNIFGYPAVTSREENDKRVFATWSKIAAGKKAEIIFDYTHRLYMEPADGTKYQFVFEKQAGTNRHYKFEIGAPVGFHFRENDLPIFEYESDDPPGRLVVELTLEKI